VAFSPDGKAVAAGFSVRYFLVVGGVVLWDAAGRKRLAKEPLAVKEGRVTSVAFSPDGKAVAAGFGAGGAGGGVVLWDAAGRKRLAEEPLAVEEGRVTSVAFSPDGKAVAAGFNVAVGDRVVGRVVLWDAASRKRLLEEPLAVEEGYVDSVAFSPDGKTVAAGYGGVGGGGSVVLWDIDRKSWERTAGRVANRNMTLGEWHQFFPDEPDYRATFPDLPLPPEVASQKRRR
jgi:WD40 repeat protein